MNNRPNMYKIAVETIEINNEKIQSLFSYWYKNRITSK